MVLPGEVLERPTLIARGTVTLEGLYHRGAKAPGVVLCAPHPRMGGSMDNPVLSELVWALARADHATLRFNFQGVGASQGTIQSAATLDSEIEDAAAAVSHLGTTVMHGRVAIAGYSFGAAVALGLALQDPSLTPVVLISPPTSMFDFTAINELKRPVLVVAGHDDSWCDRLKFAEWSLAHEGASFEVIRGADHFFSRGLTKLGKTVVRWLDRSA